MQDSRSPQPYTVTKKDLKFLYRLSDILFIPVSLFPSSFSLSGT